MAKAKKSTTSENPKKVPWADIAPTNLSPKRQSVLIEMLISGEQETSKIMETAMNLDVPGFKLDKNYPPVALASQPDGTKSSEIKNEKTVIIRGTVDVDKIEVLESLPNVIKVWIDTPIAPFAACPIPPCDCTPWVAQGTISDVAHYLGVDQIWSDGIKGTGIVIGLVDGGINAIGRTQRTGETAKIQNVIGGYPVADWGTTASAWGQHGNMTSTDAMGMAPEAHVYDIRISDGNAISNAIAGFDWAINQHRIDGTPHILSNSWGIFQQAWDPSYATDPNHPFTRKVVEALDEGILVLFAAGNCGATCPDGRCGGDTGPGKDTWGANGHPRVMTVGAVNKNEQYIGYSSAGPAALDPNKPDFCSISHFNGFFASDSGTSAACPIAAGVVALLKQSNNQLTQDQAKDYLKSTAKDIGATGWDQFSGAGIIQAKAAYDVQKKELEQDECCVSPCDPPWIVKEDCLVWYEDKLIQFPLVKANQKGDFTHVSTLREYIEFKITYQHKLCLIGKQHGSLLYTVTLLPQEKVKLFHSDRYRKITSEQQRFSIQTTFSQFLSIVHEARRTDTLDILNDKLSSSKSGSSGGGGGGFFIGLPGFGIGFGGGGSDSSQNSVTDHNLVQVRRVSSDFFQSVSQASSLTRAERSLVISTYEDKESLDVSVREIRNDNNCRAVTYFVRQVMDAYILSTVVYDISYRIIAPGVPPLWHSVNDLGWLPGSIATEIKNLLTLLPKVGDVTDKPRPFTLPTDGAVYDAELAHCCSCEPERERYHKLQNDLLEKQIELLEKSQEYRGCPVAPSVTNV